MYLTQGSLANSLEVMIVVLKSHITNEEKENVKEFLGKKGFQVREIVGEHETVLGAVGKLTIDYREVEVQKGVSRVIPISKPYKLASRELKNEDTVVSVGSVRIGGNRVAVIAGPCAVESREQMWEAAEAVRASGAVMLRGGAFKPRTSPYSFQGLGEEGLKILKETGESFGLPVVTEIVGSMYADMMKDYVDVFQVGARNMQNFELLKTVGRLGKPVVLKRGLSATIEEWLMAAEYLMASGTDNVILCERGIRTFETYTRNTLDLSAIPVVKELSHLPVIVDPSHATGLREKVLPMALAAVAAGADGLVVEVHPNPEAALSDGPQSLFPEGFESLMRDIQALSPVIGKEIERLPENRPGSVVSGGGNVGGTAVSMEKSAAFQGVRGAYSEKATHAYFGEEIPTSPCSSFKDVFEKVLAGETRYGVIPVENSLAGTINENIDLLIRYPDITVTGEYLLRIKHNLIGLPGTSVEMVEEVYSHPQGLAQCGKFFADYPSIKGVPYYDTAGAVAYVASMKESEKAAIAGEEAARVYGLEIIKSGLETNPRNYTKFFILARSGDTVEKEPNRAVIVFSTPDTPGALLKCLNVLAERRINMNKLESRPIHGKPWQYMFILSLEIPVEKELLDSAIQDLKKYADDIRILGKYKV